LLGVVFFFVGNITPDTTEEEFKDLFKPFGEINECFVNGSKGFGFIRLVCFLSS
jgi:RNA recognition motif-containing protein